MHGRTWFEMFPMLMLLLVTFVSYTRLKFDSDTSLIYGWYPVYFFTLCFVCDAWKTPSGGAVTGDSPPALGTTSPRIHRARRRPPKRQGDVEFGSLVGTCHYATGAEQFEPLTEALAEYPCCSAIRSDCYFPLAGSRHLHAAKPHFLSWGTSP